MSILFVFSSVSFADPNIASNTNSATCDDSTLETYSGTSNLSANWGANTINLHWYADENATTELTVPTTSQTCVYDSTLTPPPVSSVPQRTGYTFIGWKVRGLPDGYTRLQYIESTGTQYIDTGVKINSEKVNVKTKVLFPVLENTKTIFGSQIDTSSGFGGLVFYQPSYGGLGGCFGSSYNNATYQSISTNTVYNIEYGANNGNGSLSINGITLNTTYTGTLISNKTWYIFWSNGGRAEYKIKIQMYGIQLYDNDVLVFNGIPAKRNSDNVIGMWDKVTQTFFTNSGTGSFTAGPVAQ